MKVRDVRTSNFCNLFKNSALCWLWSNLKQFQVISDLANFESYFNFDAQVWFFQRESLICLEQIRIEKTNGFNEKAAVVTMTFQIKYKVPKGSFFLKTIDTKISWSDSNAFFISVTQIFAKEKIMCIPLESWLEYHSNCV